MRFMESVRVVVPPERLSEARALLPDEGKRVQQHLQQGILEAIYAEDAIPVTLVWGVMRADSLEHAQRLVATYPLAPFFQTTYTLLQES